MLRGTGLPKHSLQVIAVKRKPRLFSKHPSLQYQHSAAIGHPVGLCGVSVSCCCIHTHLGHCHLPAEPARSHCFHPWSPPCALLAHGGQPAALPDLATAGGAAAFNCVTEGCCHRQGLGDAGKEARSKRHQSDVGQAGCEMPTWTPWPICE